MIKKLQVVKTESDKFVIYLFSSTALEIKKISVFNNLSAAVAEAERLVSSEGLFGSTYGVMGEKAWNRL